MSITDSETVSIETDFAAITDNFGSDITDPFPLYAEMRRTQPVMEGDILAKWGVPSQADYASKGRKVFTLFKYQDVMAVLRDAQTYTSGLLADGLGQFLGDFMVSAMDGETHKAARNVLAPAFPPGAVAHWKEIVAPILHEEIIDPLTPKGRSELIADVLLPAPVRLIYAIIGYPNDKAQVEQFAAWGMRILVGPNRDPAKMEAAMKAAFQAAQDIYEHTMPIVARRRAEGAQGDDLMGYLLRASDGDRMLTDHEITLFLRTLLPAAAETTTRSFGSILVALLERPALLERIRADRSLVDKAITEGMRWSTAAQFLARECARDVEIRGVKIPKGAALSLACGSANRDEEVFPNSDEFDIDRPVRANSGFGFGPHTCTGMMVAKMEMSAMLNAMLDAWPNPASRS